MAKIKFRDKARFNLDLKRFNDLTEKQHAQLLKKVSFQLLKLIVQKNPVKTGRSQNNWQVAVDTAAGDAIIDGVRSQGVVIDSGFSALASVKPFSTVVLYNNVQYIIALEDGSSTQAPQGMVQISILEVENQFR